MTLDKHTVAIVSFEGAVKREIKRVRRVLQADESMAEFRLSIDLSGRVHDGDVKLSYMISDRPYGGGVTGDALQPVLDELLRRRGWKAVHEPKAIGYERIPSDNTDDDEVPSF